MISFLSEKAKEVATNYALMRGLTYEERDHLASDLLSALEVAYKQGARARVTGPSDQAIKDAALESEQYSGPRSAKKEMKFREGAWWYRDNLKITPLTAEDIFPSDVETANFIQNRHDKKESGLFKPFIKYLRDFVTAKLERK